VHEGAKRIATQRTQSVFEPDADPHKPAVARIRHREQPAAVPQRLLEQRSVLRVTAHHAIHDHHVRGREPVTQPHEVAFMERHLIRHATPPGLGACRGQVGGRGIDDGRMPEPRGQQLEAERSDAGADIEHRFAPAGVAHRVAHQAHGRGWPLAVVTLEVAFGDARVEDRLDRCGKA